ncbi:unnamed protein product [Ceutorhynchus assimilis]|uniref:Tektin n=1 Tax=Ceutorhynchus assimilis TaxID=467358 RepID=A0A9N9MEU8_9CUCU|nr:unnamed protein product [Ceutorhynchus assimilis]
MSVVTYEKPLPHIGLADWFAKQWSAQQTNDARRADAFKLRQEARQLRNEATIKTNWDTYHNNVRLGDRITELDRWKETLEVCLQRIEKEVGLLKDEKYETEKEIDGLGIPINIISECIFVRDNRQGAELTFDEGETELKKELSLLENVKKLLIERCQAAWEKHNKLNEVRFKLSLEINNRHESIEIDKHQLSLDKNCADISFRTDPLRIVKNSLPNESWLEHSSYLNSLAENELAETLKMREALFIDREHAKNDISAQRDRVDFILLALQPNADALKLVETRLENRSNRPGFELSRDEVEQGLKEEVLQLRQTRDDLKDKINCARATYNALEEQQVLIDRELDSKNQSLKTDIQCLDLRAQLRIGSFAAPETETDRNILLTRMEKEIPSTT